MPSVFLSPSTQEYNTYITGSGSEEYWMNQIADAMEPYLLASGIRYGRNDPAGTAVTAIRQGNQGSYDLYLALHSNASGDGSAPGGARGIVVFHYPNSSGGTRAAELIAAELRKIYPLPERVTVRATTALGEVRQPRMPAVLAELGYHDNISDALWIESRTASIAHALCAAVAEYLGVPLVDTCMDRTGLVTTRGGALNLRAAPSLSAPVLRRLPNGTALTVCGARSGWYTVRAGDVLGFVSADYVTLT